MRVPPIASTSASSSWSPPWRRSEGTTPGTGARPVRRPAARGPLRAPGRHEAEDRPLPVRAARRHGGVRRAFRDRAADLRCVLGRPEPDALAALHRLQRGRGVAWSALFAFGAFGLGAAATGVGQAITLVGLGLSAVLTAAGLGLARPWTRPPERR